MTEKDLIIQDLRRENAELRARVPQWISVDDRLPEDDKQRVMVAYIGDYPIGYPKIDTDRYVRGHWVRYGGYVTHWMPLPEPPKGE